MVPVQATSLLKELFEAGTDWLKLILYLSEGGHEFNFKIGFGFSLESAIRVQWDVTFNPCPHLKSAHACLQTSVYFPVHVLRQTNLLLILCVLTEILLDAKVRRKKWLKDFKFCIFIIHFQLISWQWKGYGHLRNLPKVVSGMGLGQDFIYIKIFNNNINR